MANDTKASDGVYSVRLKVWVESNLLRDGIQVATNKTARVSFRKEDLQPEKEELKIAAMENADSMARTNESNASSGVEALEAMLARYNPEDFLNTRVVGKVTPMADNSIVLTGAGLGKEFSLAVYDKPDRFGCRLYAFSKDDADSVIRNDVWAFHPTIMNYMGMYNFVPIYTECRTVTLPIRFELPEEYQEITSAINAKLVYEYDFADAAIRTRAVLHNTALNMLTKGMNASDFESLAEIEYPLAMTAQDSIQANADSTTRTHYFMKSLTDSENFATKAATQHFTQRH